MLPAVTSIETTAAFGTRFRHLTLTLTQMPMSSVTALSTVTLTATQTVIQ